MPKWYGSCSSVDCTQYQGSKCFIGLPSSLIIEGIKYDWILSQIILLVMVVLKRKLRTCKFNNITDWNICLLYSHFPLHMFTSVLTLVLLLSHFFFCCCGFCFCLMYYCVVWIWSGNLYCILCLYLHFILHA